MDLFFISAQSLDLVRKIEVATQSTVTMTLVSNLFVVLLSVGLSTAEYTHQFVHALFLMFRFLPLQFCIACGLLYQRNGFIQQDSLIGPKSQYTKIKIQFKDKEYDIGKNYLFICVCAQILGPCCANLSACRPCCVMCGLVGS